MGAPIRVNVIPTFADYLRLNLHVSLRGFPVLRRLPVWGLISLIPFGVLSLAAYPFAPLLFAGLGENPSWFEAYMAALPLLLLPLALFLLAGIYLAARHRWRIAGELREPRTYIFSDVGIQVAASSFEGTSTWQHIVRAERAGPIILLGTAQQAFHLIPVAAFDSEDDFERFLDLVARKVPKNQLF